MQRIKSELASLFTEVFKRELQNNGGYVLVDGVAMDNKYDRTRIQAPNKVRNEAVTRKMLGEWAKLLRLALDEARTVISKKPNY